MSKITVAVLVLVAVVAGAATGFVIRASSADTEATVKLAPALPVDAYDILVSDCQLVFGAAVQGGAPVAAAQLVSFCPGTIRDLMESIEEADCYDWRDVRAIVNGKLGSTLSDTGSVNDPLDLSIDTCSQAQPPTTTG